ncbi:myristoylated alanine-rich C-kinase substrate-like protein [Anopheles sinensis]|uniref:Myristoylated alanine-rich C-kinase substrate-like protein n=1 Tax=Anopheles sinensis TaxID=74873 RepID=A0A084WLX8_ANOSI|nr:myristoylated alanine-rich C-kinase substrate-like protein [Anopheles sinensis]
MKATRCRVCRPRAHPEASRQDGWHFREAVQIGMSVVYVLLERCRVPPLCAKSDRPVGRPRRILSFNIYGGFRAPGRLRMMPSVHSGEHRYDSWIKFVFQINFPVC